MGASTDQPPVGRPPLLDVSEELAARVPSPAAEGDGVVAVTLGDLTRDQLDDRARAAGVDEPEKLANKQAVIDAIETAETTPSGEGATPNPED